MPGTGRHSPYSLLYPRPHFRLLSWLLSTFPSLWMTEWAVLGRFTHECSGNELSNNVFLIVEIYNFAAAEIHTASGLTKLTLTICISKPPSVFRLDPTPRRYY